MDRRGFRLQGLDDRGQRHDQRLAGNGDHHAIENGERQRQAHGEDGAVTWLRRDVDAAAERLDRTLDHVHADAATREVGDLVGRREAGMEDQVVDFLVRQIGIGRDQVVVDGLLADTLRG